MTLVKLSYHAPEGLAACQDENGAYHCDRNDQPAYQRRFHRSFGFYDGLAAVVDDSGWYHIRPDGSDAYARRFQWTGNFQGKLCAVQDGQGFHHIRADGTDAYPQRFSYVGDFRYGIAVAWEGGKAFHIREDGSRLNGYAYECAGQFHKGHALARDDDGWFHVSIDGKEISPARWRRAEDFYNGVALCEDHRGRMVRLRENGFYTLIPFQTEPLFPSALRCLIEGGARAAVIIRHGKRQHIDDAVTWGNEASLTEDGAKTCLRLGSLFQGIDSAAFSSPLRRCMQTATNLLQGAGLSGDAIQDGLLGNPGCYFDGSFRHEGPMKSEGRFKFVEEYITVGRQVGMRRLESESEALLAHMEGKMAKPLNWFVSHDIHVACLMHFCGLRAACEVDWVRFLEGIAIVKLPSGSVRIHRFLSGLTDESRTSPEEPSP